ncbi:unnamed protein product [Boreogadus saida]
MLYLNGGGKHRKASPLGNPFLFDCLTELDQAARYSETYAFHSASWSSGGGPQRGMEMTRHEASFEEGGTEPVRNVSIRLIKSDGCCIGAPACAACPRRQRPVEMKNISHQLRYFIRDNRPERDAAAETEGEADAL